MTAFQFRGAAGWDSAALDRARASVACRRCRFCPIARQCRGPVATRVVQGVRFWRLAAVSRRGVRIQRRQRVHTACREGAALIILTLSIFAFVVMV